VSAATQLKRKLIAEKDKFYRFVEHKEAKLKGQFKFLFVIVVVEI